MDEDSHGEGFVLRGVFSRKDCFLNEEIIGNNKDNV